MQKEEMIKKLKGLAHLDIDAWHAYGQAMDRLDDAGVRHKMEKFQQDHERHVKELSELIRELGGDPPQFSRDFKGFLIEGWTALRSVTGTQGALAAMETNERLTNRKYAEAANLPFPAEVHAVVASGYEDEKEHLAYIEKMRGYWVKEKGDEDRSQYY